MTDLHTAAKLALEALENIRAWPETREALHQTQAITALRQALANSALDKMAENARELGLGYEPAQCWKCGDMDAVGHAKCTVPACGMKEQPAQQEPVYAFRRKGQDSFCTCDKARYLELAKKPNLFEVNIFYTTPQPPAQPLTQDMVESCPYDGETMRGAYFEGWLKAEAAHGIKGDK